MGHTNTEIQLYHEKDTAIFISHFQILSSFFERQFGAYSHSLFGFSVIYLVRPVRAMQSVGYRKYILFYAIFPAPGLVFLRSGFLSNIIGVRVRQLELAAQHFF